MIREGHRRRPRAGRGARVAALAALALAAPVLAAATDDHADWSGRRIMEESFHRHQQFPYVYEELTLVLIDEAGHRQVRDARRFSRASKDGEVKFLLVFDDPEEIRGVALLATRMPDGDIHSSVYLPAFGPQMRYPTGDAGSEYLLGTDLELGDLAPEPPGEFRYLRRPDRVREHVGYFVVDAWPRGAPADAPPVRRHQIRQDNLVVVETEYFDPRGHLLRRLTRHDLVRVAGASWRANVIAVDNVRDHHMTMLKIARRVYSSAYVPAALFEPSALFAGRHLRSVHPRFLP